MKSDQSALSFAGNFDLGYRQTQYFAPHHNAAVGQWDTRLEFWLPPFERTFSWGPYFRVAGIGASEAEAWEDGWLAGPGVGLQAYPFSYPKISPAARKLLGPIRLFSEYNRLHYWGAENTWRPDDQTRAGLEYWKASHVNELKGDSPKERSYIWTETWVGLSWQSANEFDPNYHAWIAAAAFRSGVRAAKSGSASLLTPYVAIETSVTSHPSYYWENRLITGGGLRITPSLIGCSPDSDCHRLNRFVIYGEYMPVSKYYRASAPATVPDHDVRAGISFSIGRWYR